MVMIVLGLLAAYLVESASDRYAVATLAQLSRQTEQAAASGLEWGRARALQSASCATAQWQFAGTTVDVVCVTVQVTEDGVSYPVYDVTADARHGNYGDFDHVRRTARARYAAR